MDGMNQNNNNPNGQQNDSYQANNTYQPNDPQQVNGPYQQSDPQQVNGPYQLGNPQQVNSPYQSGDPYQTNNTYQSGDPYQHNPYQPQGNPGGQVVYAYNPQGQKKGSAAKILIGIACALVAVIGIGIGVLAYFMSTPAYKVQKGLANLAKDIAENSNPLTDKLGMDDIAEMLQEDGGHVQTILNVTVDIPSEDRITVGVDTNYYKDVRAKELSADTSVSVMNNDLFSFNMYANDEVFAFSIPELFLEDVYIENENLVSQYNNSIFGSIYPSDMEDFSIDLFQDNKDKTSLSGRRNQSSAWGKLENDIDACRKAMTIEKVEKGLYRVTFPAKETDRLYKRILESVYQDDELREYLFPDDYKKIIASDISLLFEINGKNRIDSIMLEEPVEMLDGEASMDGEIFFLGEKISTDKIQGKMTVNGVDGETREIILQIQQTSDADRYQMDMDMKYTESGDTLGMMKCVVNCDAKDDEFDMTCSVKDDWDSVEIIVQGSFDDIVKGENWKIDLDKASFSMNGEEYIKITGDIIIEPLRNGVISSVKPKTALFEMTYTDWLEIIYRLEDESSLLDYLMDYMW